MQNWMEEKEKQKEKKVPSAERKVKGVQWGGCTPNQTSASVQTEKMTRSEKAEEIERKS